MDFLNERYAKDIVNRFSLKVIVTRWPGTNQIRKILAVFTAVSPYPLSPLIRHCELLFSWHRLLDYFLYRPRKVLPNPSTYVLKTWQAGDLKSKNISDIQSEKENFLEIRSEIINYHTEYFEHKLWCFKIWNRSEFALLHNVSPEHRKMVL